jgi:ADP-heptose:LPS heptosyltransferase
MAGKHILVIRLSAMGDVAMTVPVLRALLLQHSGVKVTVLSREFYRPFFDGIPNLNFVAADLKGRHKGFWGLFRLFRELSKLKIDAVADLHNVLRSKILTTIFRFSGVKIATTDKARAEKKALTRAENKIFKPLKPIVQRHAETFEKLGFPVNLNNPIFPERPEISAEVQKLAGEKSGKWIGIAPFAQHQGKVYPPDLIQEVINELSKNYSHKIFLFGGGEAEQNQLENFAEGLQNVVVTAGKLRLKDELNLIANLDVMLSMDSGNAHIAAMYGIKTISLWGATHPYVGFAPFHQPESHQITSDRNQFPQLPTSIYGHKIVPGYEDAMRTITPKQVVDKFYEIINP